jgi:hypothetical protein
MSIFFYKGNQNILDPEENKKQSIEPTKKIQEAFLKVLDNKNLSFLLGSGCSSYKIERQEIGIPTMAPMAQEFYTSSDFKEDKEWLLSSLKIDVEDKNFEKNLEAFLSVLHSLSFYHSKINNESDEDAQKINQVIKEARNFILEKCLNEKNIKDKRDNELLEVYKTFYKKLLTRNSTLPRLNIFTTNYDLYSERAMDSLGIQYVNGFTGGISKYFNPTIFNYALAEKMDLSQSKWNVIDNFFYLYKIHGSVNWVENDDEGKLFKIQEIQDPPFDTLKDKETVMIYPTPLKYNASLGSPYSDLFREFQKKLMQNNNILVTIGYSFSDEHINNLIFQAFTIPSFRLIIIGDPSPDRDNKDTNITKLQKLDDSRIWIIGEKMPEDKNGEKDWSYIPINYFNRFVNEILPDLTNEDLDKKLESINNNLRNF